MTNPLLPSASSDTSAAAGAPAESVFAAGVNNQQRSNRSRWFTAMRGFGVLVAAGVLAGPSMAWAETPLEPEADPPPFQGAPARRGAEPQKLKITLAVEKPEALKAPKAIKAVTNKKSARPAPPPEEAEEGGDEAQAPEAEKKVSPAERASRGVVTIERGGQPIGLGTVLSGDGRVLSALSPLGHGNDLNARFADGSTVRVKLGHHDRTWDLALLVPQTGKWQEGLTASSRDPVREDVGVRSFSLLKGKPASVDMMLKAHRTLLGGDDSVLESAIEVGSRVLAGDLGSPVIDEDGRVVAMLGRGCAPAAGKPCTPVAFAVPMTAIKSFLRTVPATAVPPTAWLGIQGVPEAGSVARGVRVLSVHPESPADAAKLKGGERTKGDTILAVNGIPVTTPDELAEAIRFYSVGEKVPLTVFSHGKYKQVEVELKAAPEAKPGQPAPEPAELPAADQPAPRRSRVR